MMRTKNHFFAMVVIVLALASTLAGCHASQSTSPEAASPQAPVSPTAGQNAMSSQNLSARNARMQQQRQSGND